MNYVEMNMKKPQLNHNSPLSDLQLLLEAEEELNSIFSRRKNQPVNRLMKRAIDSSSSDSSYSWNSQVSSNYYISTQADSFSKYGHFKAPIKRPSCNPLIKDERFKRMNTANEALFKNQDAPYDF